MSDDPLEVCESCAGQLRKVLHPVSIHFKGSGFYTTDYGKGSGRRRGASDASGSEGSAAATSGTAATAEDGVAGAAEAPSAGGGGSLKTAETKKAT